MAMDMEYGVKVFNKFDISALGEDDDPYEILKRAEAKKKDEKAKDLKEKSTKSVSKSGKQSKKAQVTAQEQQKNRQNESSSFKQDGENRPPRREQSSRQDRGGKFQRDSNRDNDDNRRERRPPRDENVAPHSDFRSDKPERFGGDGERGRGRGRGGNFRGRGRGRGGGGREGFDRFGKREFDRHSGSDKTGVKPVDKRGGKGPHNWGDDKDEMERGQLNDSVEETQEWAPTNPDAENQDPNESNENNDADAETTEKVEDEPKQMTLEEYKASVAKARVRPEFNTRRANEGSDQKQWKNLTVIESRKKKDSESEEESDEEEEYDDRRHSNKPAVDIQIQFNDNPRRGAVRGRGGGRGGRGGGRGRGRGGFGDRGGGRGDRGQRESVPKVDDEEAFPSLIKPS